MILKEITVLQETIFQNTDIIKMSKFMLGKILVSTIENKIIVSRIVETEAYRAPDDKGSHAYQNRRTNRTEIMFGKGGRAYVYLCYGLHNMLNIVSGPEEHAHAILIRAVEPLNGWNTIFERRNISSVKPNLTNGPGKLCSALGITRKHNGINLFDTESPLWLGWQKELDEKEIISSPRVGIAYAEECALWPWRFRIKKSGWTSPPATVNY